MSRIWIPTVHSTFQFEFNDLLNVISILHTVNVKVTQLSTNATIFLLLCFFGVNLVCKVEPNLILSIQYIGLGFLI